MSGIISLSCREYRYCIPVLRYHTVARGTGACFSGDLLKWPITCTNCIVVIFILTIVPLTKGRKTSIIGCQKKRQEPAGNASSSGVSNGATSRPMRRRGPAAPDRLSVEQFLQVSSPHTQECPVSLFTVLTIGPYFLRKAY
jgi:hypothetical protein